MDVIESDEIPDDETQVDPFRIVYATSKEKTFRLSTSHYSSVVARGNKPHGNGLQRRSYP